MRSFRMPPIRVTLGMRPLRLQSTQGTLRCRLTHPRNYPTHLFRSTDTEYRWMILINQYIVLYPDSNVVELFREEWRLWYVDPCAQCQR